MYKIQKTMEICGSHQLKLNYDSPCSQLHGHNWNVTIYMRADKLDENGMIFDFAKIKKLVHDRFDHKHLNDIINFNPTAENLACYICSLLNTDHTVADIERGLRCYRVDVEETKNNIATFEEEQ